MTEKTINLIIEGMHCANCALGIEKNLRKLGGILYAAVSFSNYSASVKYDENIITLKEIIEAIKDLGYTAKEDKKNIFENREYLNYKRQKNNLIFSILLTLPIVVISMFNIEIPYKNFVLFILTSLIMFFPGRQFFTGTYKSLKNKMADMNVLIAVGTASAYIFSVVSAFFPQFFNSSEMENHLYFEVSAVIITLIITGRTIEEAARSKTSDAIKKLIDLQPKKAHIVDKDGSEREIPAEDLKIGDIAIVKPGERIPSDGFITEGDSTVDQSAITGESLPIDKKPQDKVLGGTMNITGSFKYKVTNVGSESLIGQIIELVAKAQSSKAPVQRLADKVSGYFVQAVVLIALTAFVVWFVIGKGHNLSFALTVFVSILIISCPCALGLATPTAITAGMGLGAKNGILIKDGESLEKAEKIKVIVLDKTGTITIGKPQVSDIVTDTDYKDFLGLCAGAESASEHPYAKAVINKAKGKGISFKYPQKFLSRSGFGIEAQIEGKSIVIGKKNLLENNNISTEKFSKNAEKLAGEGKTVAYAAVDGKIQGLIAFSDTIKHDSISAVKEIKKLGIKPVMATGDNKMTAENIARLAGIDDYKAEVLPQDKAEVVRHYQEQGLTTAVVGDGTNDSPALSQADVGFAVGGGSDIAAEAGSVVIMSGSLTDVVKAVKLSKKTMQTVRLNLFLAFIYNIIAIPVAAGVIYPFTRELLNPMIAAFAMSLSSISAVLNSLRLKMSKI